MTRLRLLLAALLLISVPAVSFAQDTATPTITPTPTPTITPTNTNTPTNTPTATPPLEMPAHDPPLFKQENIGPARTTTGWTYGVWVGPYTNKSIQVCAAAGTCTSYSLVVDTTNADPPVWTAVSTPTTEANAGQGACTFVRLASSDQWLRVRVTAITACSLTFSLGAN